MKFFKLTLAGIILSISSLANAGLIEQLDNYTYYEVGNGLEWVYASPCAGDSNINGTCNLSPITLIDGFHYASTAEWVSSFADLSELIGAFDLNNYDPIVCASPYFGSGHNHCDSNDVQSGYVWGAPLGIAASISFSQSSIAETFLVRGQLRDIPEPTTLAIFALGLFGLGLRKSKS